MEEYSSKTRLKYERLSTAALEELVELDSSLEDGESLPTDELVAICEIIAERDRQAGKYTEADVQAAKERFYKYYYPIKSPKSIWDFGSDSTKSAPKSKVSTIRPRHFIRAAVAAAVILSILFMLAITGYADGFKVIGSVATWTRDTFNLSGITEKSGPSEAKIPEILTGLKECMEDAGISTSLLPTFFPDGYECITSESDILKGEAQVVGLYSNGEYNILFVYKNTLDGTNNSHFQKDEGEPSVYISGSNEFYITTNMDKYAATWLNGTILCDISGVPSYEILLQIIESIGA